MMWISAHFKKENVEGPVRTYLVTKTVLFFTFAAGLFSCAQVNVHLLFLHIEDEDLAFSYIL